MVRPSIAETVLYPKGRISLTYIGFFNDTTNVTVGNTYTISGIDVGVPVHDRLVIVAMSANATSTFTGVTIGGIAATQTATQGSGVLSLYQVRLPYSSQISVSATVATANANNFSVGVWTLKNYMSATATHTNSGNATASSLSLDLNVPQNGVGIWYARGAVGAVSPIGWTDDVTSRYVEIVETSNNQNGADASVYNAETLTGTMNWTGNSTARIVGAAWQ